MKHIATPTSENNFRTSWKLTTTHWRQHDLHEIQRDEITAWIHIPVISLIMYILGPYNITMPIILAVLTMILYHYLASGAQSRLTEGKSPKNIIKYMPGIYNYV
jgi:hypothetical protein